MKKKQSFFQKMVALRKRGQSTEGYSKHKTVRDTAVKEGVKRNLEGSVYKKGKKKA